MEIPLPTSVAFPLVAFLIGAFAVATVAIIWSKSRDYFANKRIVEKLIKSFEDVRQQLERLAASDDNHSRQEHYIKLDERPFIAWRNADRQDREGDPLTEQIIVFRQELNSLPGTTSIRGIAIGEAQKIEIRRYADTTLMPLLDNIIANIRADYRGRQLWRPVNKD